jgi:NAD(P)-dependent dehydrogenase (short-subunit alcohol dehydrogenase family)
VTGGDSAIGRAAAIAYAKEGADVAINYGDILACIPGTSCSCFS